jgi:hypothetical protein
MVGVLGLLILNLRQQRRICDELLGLRSAIERAFPDSKGHTEQRRPPLVDDGAGVPPTVDDVRAFVESTFNREAVDPSWAVSTRAALTKMIRDHLSEGSSLEEIACRTSLCRIVLRHRDDPGDLTFMRSTNGRWPGGYFVWRRRQLASGQVEVIVFAAGRGQNVSVREQSSPLASRRSL